jgi:membrane protein
MARRGDRLGAVLPRHARPRVGALVSFVAGVLRHSGRDRILISASSLAFHWFIAIVPGAIAIIRVTNLVGLTSSRLQSLSHDLTVLLPASASKVFDQALQSKGAGSSAIVAVVVASLVSLWASIESASTLQVALDMAYETDADRGFLARRVRGVVLFAITIVFGGGAFALLVVGAALGSLVRPTGSGAWFPVLWTTMRWVVGIACVAALISLYDLLGPSHEDRRWRLLTVGGIVSTALWLGVASCYSYYLDHFGHSSEAYGALSGVVALLLWLFLTAAVILVGAEVNRELLARKSAQG